MDFLKVIGSILGQTSAHGFHPTVCGGLFVIVGFTLAAKYPELVAVDGWEQALLEHIRLPIILFGLMGCGAILAMINTILEMRRGRAPEPANEANQ